jgi:cell wall-associated NlpC family hydrolase
MKASAEKPFSESWAFAYMSIPFVDRGMGWDGCDCWSLCALIFKTRLGIELPLYPEVESVTDPAMLRTFMREAKADCWEEISAGQEQPYDVVMMRGFVDVEGRKAARPVHVGIVVQPGRLIHIEKGVGVSVADYRNHPSVKHRVITFYRYKRKK